MMGKKGSQFSLMTSCFKDTHKTAPVLFPCESTHKTP